MSNFITSLIRTYVPILVGAIASYLLSKGLELDPETQAGLIIALTGALQALYYYVVRMLERKVNPEFGKLLGVASKPKYQ